MDRALWLLLALRFRGWVRRLTRMLRTPKGILLGILGAMLFVPMLFSFIFQMVAPQEMHLRNPTAVREYGPLVLFGYCIVVVLFSTSERTLTFTPAEVDFLFPGPFSRRQLLGYKIVAALLNSLLSTVLTSIIFQAYVSHFLCAFVGLLLAMTFLQLFSIAVALIANTLGALVYSRARKLALAGVVVLVAAALLPVAQDIAQNGWPTVFKRLPESPAVRVVLAPLSWFVEAYAAENVWPDLVQNALLALAVNGVLLGLVFALDAKYLESSAAASERLYARLQRLRSGGGAMSWAGGGKARFRLPLLPWWGGAGPTAWRQGLTALRNLKGLLFFIGMLSLTFLVPVLVREPDDPAKEIPGIAPAVGVLALSLFVLPSLLTFDFRGDLDRIDYLKSLPLSPHAVVVGEVLVPAVMTGLVQVVLVGLLQVVFGGIGLLLLGTVVFAWPFNFLLFAVENLVFLAFPTRLAAMAPGDFQQLGRHVLLYAAKGLLLGLILGMTATAAMLAYFLAGRSVLAAAATAWVLILAADVALVPALAFLFRRFDVSHDTPP